MCGKRRRSPVRPPYGITRAVRSSRGPLVASVPARRIVRARRIGPRSSTMGSHRRRFHGNAGSTRGRSSAPVDDGTGSTGVDAGARVRPPLVEDRESGPTRFRGNATTRGNGGADPGSVHPTGTGARCARCTAPIAARALDPPRLAPALDPRANPTRPPCPMPLALPRRSPVPSHRTVAIATGALRSLTHVERDTLRVT